MKRACYTSKLQSRAYAKHIQKVFWSQKIKFTERELISQNRHFLICQFLTIFFASHIDTKIFASWPILWLSSSSSTTGLPLSRTKDCNIFALWTRARFDQFQEPWKTLHTTIKWPCWSKFCRQYIPTGPSIRIQVFNFPQICCGRFWYFYLESWVRFLFVFTDVFLTPQDIRQVWIKV